MRNLLISLLCALWGVAHASTEIVRQNGVEIQIQPFPSTFLTPAVANTYGFERSRRQTLLNVVVLTVQPDGQASGAIPASVAGFAKNLLGQTQALNFREINEGPDAIYYLAPVRVSNQETIQFVLEVVPEGGRAIDVSFRRTLYVE